MIQEARKLHPAMLAVGIGFLAVFLGIIGATIQSVLADEMPDTPLVDDLELPIGVKVIDRQLTCSPDACDGEGAVVASRGMSPQGVSAMIEGRLRSASWIQIGCTTAETCLHHGELTVEMIPWADLIDDPATAAMRRHLEGLGTDQAGYVYVRVSRCGIVNPCP